MKGLTPAQNKLWLKHISKFGLTKEPDKCNIDVTAQYLRVTSSDKPSIDRVFYDANNNINPNSMRPVQFRQADGSTRFLQPKPLSSKLKLSLQDAIAQYKKIGIKMEPFIDRSDFQNKVQSGIYNGNSLLISIVMTDSKDTPFVGGGAGIEFLKVESSATHAVYTAQIMVAEHNPNPTLVFLHELAHTFGVGHMGQNFNPHQAPCMVDGKNSLTLPQEQALQMLMVQHQCIVPYQECGSVMFCQPHPDCMSTLKTLTPADKLVIREQFEKMTGKPLKPLVKVKKKKKTNTSPSSKTNRVELMQFCPETNPLHCTHFSPNATLRHRVNTTEVEFVYEIEADTTDPDLLPVSEQSWYAQYSYDAWRAFICAFSIALSNQLIQRLGYTKAECKYIEPIIDGMITAFIYGVPVAIFSLSFDYISDKIIQFLVEHENADEKYLQMLKPYLPIVINTLVDFFKRKTLATILSNLSHGMMSFVINMLSAQLGVYVATYFAGKSFLNTEEKQKME